MKNFEDEYRKELENELNQFIPLCGKNDAQLLLSQTKKHYSYEYFRLACICMAFGYKKIMLNIFALAQKNIKRLFNDMEKLNGNFAQVDEWVTEFINNIDVTEAQKIARQFWQERTETLDRENFSLKNLLKV